MEPKTFEEQCNDLRAVCKETEKKVRELMNADTFRQQCRQGRGGAAYPGRAGWGFRIERSTEMKEYDYAGAYTDRTIDHALKRGLRATASIRGEIIESADALSPAEKALADDAVAALNEANSRIGRLTYLRIPNMVLSDKEPR